jgi:hypothetical protein
MRGEAQAGLERSGEYSDRQLSAGVSRPTGPSLAIPASADLARRRSDLPIGGAPALPATRNSGPVRRAAPTVPSRGCGGRSPRLPLSAKADESTQASPFPGRVATATSSKHTLIVGARCRLVRRVRCGPASARKEAFDAHAATASPITTYRKRSRTTQPPAPGSTASHALPKLERRRPAATLR